MYCFFAHMCVWAFFKQYNRTVDQSVCGLKGWPWCWAHGSVLRMTKDNVTYPQPQPREVAEGTVPTRWLGMTGCFHLSDSHYIHVSIIFHFQSFWKLADLGQLSFLWRTPRFKQLQILFPACTFQLENLAAQQWEQVMEWLRKQQGVNYKGKGKKCSPAQSFPLPSIKLHQQVWEPGAEVEVLPAMHKNALL